MKMKMFQNLKIINKLMSRSHSLQHLKTSIRPPHTSILHPLVNDTPCLSEPETTGQAEQQV